MKKRSFFLKQMARGIFLLLVFLFSIEAIAQEVSVTGKVTDETGAGLPGVTIVEKGTMNGSITDFNGIYSIKTDKNATLNFSFVGMRPQEISVAGRTSINVVLEEESIGLDEVVAVGYGTQRKADLTGAIEVVEMKSIENVTLSSGNPMQA
ncbi:MAG: carboxypeptidase-like regulatory domain-containing protein, partial [Bacteroidota bacterium]|nr:carboxypeptidase-like regulatory domain-containing protein [Bacteroidota bacterium]